MKTYVNAAVLIFAISAAVIYFKSLAEAENNVTAKKAEHAYTEARKGGRCTAFDCKTFCRAFMHIDAQLRPYVALNMEQMLPDLCVGGGNG